jgi:hypothetical protein
MPFLTRPGRERWDRDPLYICVTVPSSEPNAAPAPGQADRL